jgi:uncharacterized protein (TIGR02996 family)
MSRRASRALAPPRPEVLAFLHAIKETPAADAWWLVCTDWSEERGEFLRLPCALETVRKWGRDLSNHRSRPRLRTVS